MTEPPLKLPFSPMSECTFDEMRDALNLLDREEIESLMLKIYEVTGGLH